jgi:hypothetical protein
VYELLLDEDEKGLWEYEVFGALACHLASRLKLRRTDAKAFGARQPGFARERIELHHNLAVLRHRLTRRYWVLDSHDWIAPFNSSLQAFALDRRCRAVLKCQYARAPYAGEPLTKIRPWTYFETYSSRFQALLPELRAIPKVRQPLFFRGNTDWAGRQPILAGLAERGVVLRDFALQMPYESYARELAAHRVALALEGMGKLCHREIEAFGAGTPVLMPRLRVELHEPLIPDHHYVAVDADTGVEPPEEVVRRIAERYRQVTADPGYLDFVATNALAWYDRNVRMPASLDLTLRLLDLGTEQRHRNPRPPHRPDWIADLYRR